MNFRKNVLVKKAWRHGAQIPRCWYRISAASDAWNTSPPILVNSFPKSGTHLLVQIMSVLPRVRDWGNFWASQPSFTFREQDPSSMGNRISKVAPGELVCGHLFHSEEVDQTLSRRRVAQFYIFRDPRDVVVSEAHYLANMNRWHRLHGRFRRIQSSGERIRLSISGLPKGDIYYPNIARRYERFNGWLNRSDVCAITYEELTSDDRAKALKKIFDFYCDHSGLDLNVTALVEQAALAIQPSRSHTFRRGGSGAWRNEFDESTKELFKSVAGKLVIDLGYERSFEW